MKYCKLIDVCDFQGGSQPPKSDWITEPKDGYIRMLQIRDFTQNYGKPEYVKITSAIKTCKSDDILIARYGASVGKILTGLSGAYNVGIMNTIPNEKILLKRYLYYFLKSNLFQNYILNVGSRAAQAGFNKEDLAGINIQVHSIETQKNIILQLENIDKLINLRKKAIEKCNNLIKSQFVEMFVDKNYPLKTLESISNNKGEYGAGSASVPYDYTRPRYVRITDINEDGTLNEDYVSSIDVNDDITYKLEYGDFMFARMGATVGKTYAYEKGNQIFAGYLIRFKLNTDIVNPKYLFWFTKTNKYKEWVKLNQSGAAQPGINAKKYGLLEIPIPPIELQNKFAKIVEQIDKQKFVGTKIARLLGKIAILC